MGTFFSANLGMWQFAKPASYITGYRVEIGDGGIDSATTQAHVRTASGVTTYANITTTGVGTAQVISAGITQNIAMQSPMPYRLVAKKAANYPVGFSIPFCVTWLAGLTATDISTEVNQCCFWLNYDTPASTDLFGNYPDSASVANSGDSYSVTINPKY